MSEADSIRHSSDPDNARIGLRSVFPTFSREHCREQGCGGRPYSSSETRRRHERTLHGGECLDERGRFRPQPNPLDQARLPETAFRSLERDRLRDLASATPVVGEVRA